MSFRLEISLKGQLGTWHGRACGGMGRASLSCKSSNRACGIEHGRTTTGMGRANLFGIWHFLNSLEAWPHHCQARPCLIFLHKIFIFLSSINSKSCSRSFYPLIMLQNPFFCSKTQSFTIFVPEIK